MQGRRSPLRLDNHNLDTDLPKPLYPLYDYMKQLGPEIDVIAATKTAISAGTK